jgi:hypothetical protein
MIAGRWTAKVRFEGDADQAAERKPDVPVNMRRLVYLTHPALRPELTVRLRERNGSSDPPPAAVRRGQPP